MTVVQYKYSLCCVKQIARSHRLVSANVYFVIGDLLIWFSEMPRDIPFNMFYCTSTTPCSVPPLQWISCFTNVINIVITIIASQPTTIIIVNMAQSQIHSPDLPRERYNFSLHDKFSTILLQHLMSLLSHSIHVRPTVAIHVVGQRLLKL